MSESCEIRKVLVLLRRVLACLLLATLCGVSLSTNRIFDHKLGSVRSWRGLCCFCNVLSPAWLRMKFSVVIMNECESERLRGSGRGVFQDTVQSFACRKRGKYKFLMVCEFVEWNPCLFLR